jgi:DNA-binding NarL/FixJ family response regulator
MNAYSRELSFEELPMTMLRILLADDHILIRAGLKRLIEDQNDMQVVGEASNGREACDIIPHLLPDIVVMDISMPDMNGAKATETITRTYPNVKILVLSAHEDETYYRQLLRMGASGYLLKRSVADELIQAIQVIREGGIYLCTEVARQVVGTYSQPEQTRPSTATLSEREAEVLRCLAWGHTNKEIGEMLHISVKTVETHRARCMEKLNLNSRADIVRYALAQGWLQDN